MHFLLYIKYSENNWCWNKSAENWNIIHRCEDRQNSVRTPMSYTSNAMWTLLTSLLKGCYYITCRVKNYLSQQNLIIWQFLYKFQLGLSIVTINLWNQRLAARRRHSRLVASRGEGEDEGVRVRVRGEDEGVRVWGYCGLLELSNYIPLFWEEEKECRYCESVEFTRYYTLYESRSTGCRVLCKLGRSAIPAFHFEIECFFFF
jgi:hypothetical protein